MEERLVFILGAGFSKPAGAPLVTEFLSKAREIFYGNAGLTTHDVESFKKVFAYHEELRKIKFRANTDIDNIENFFSMLDIDLLRKEDKKNDEDVREALIHLIIKTLDSSILEPNYEYYRRYLRTLYKNNKQFSIISFNYDLILEKVLQGECDYFYPLEKKKEGYKGVPLLKLHGSSNWGACSNGSCNNIVLFGEKMLQNSQCSKCANGRLVPLLIPPTWNKRLESPAIRNMWEMAYNEISMATRIAIIGYSFPITDLYFRFFFSLALKASERLKKIYAVDIDPNIESRYSDFLEENFRKRYFHFIKTLPDSMGLSQTFLGRNTNEFFQ